MKVYLDNGATTRTDPEVAQAMMEFLTESYGNASSLHDFGQDAYKALENARSIIAKKINAEPEEIIFTSGGTESDNLAIKGVVYASKERGNHIITSRIEHPAVLNSCKELESEGFLVTYLDVDKEGFVDLKKLEASLTAKTVLVTLMHANNEIGTIEPVEEIGRICREHKVLFHTDAVQSFTKLNIDVKRMNIDILSASGHKIHGPKGVGVLYLKKGVKIHKMIDGGGQEHKLRAGTENISGAVGFAKAVQLANDSELERMRKLRDRLMDSLLQIEHTQLNGSREKRLCNNVNISFHFVEGEALLLSLNDQGIAVSTGSACSSKSLTPSHVLTAIGLRPEISHGSIRFTLSRYTTEQEIDYTIAAVKMAVEKLRQFSPLRAGVVVEG
jgi:cysteine desulfurase